MELELGGQTGKQLRSRSWTQGDGRLHLPSSQSTVPLDFTSKPSDKDKIIKNLKTVTAEPYFPSVGPFWAQSPVYLYQSHTCDTSPASWTTYKLSLPSLLVF